MFGVIFVVLSGKQTNGKVGQDQVKTARAVKRSKLNTRSCLTGSSRLLNRMWKNTQGVTSTSIALMMTRQV